MGPPAVSLVLVVLGLITALPEPMVHAEEETSKTPKTQRNEVNTRFNRIESRLDGMETAISDMKDFLQLQMEAMDKKVERALMDIKPRRDVTTEKPQVYRDCQEALTHGVNTSGIYTIAPDQSHFFNVYCEQKLNGGGWTVFQARKDGSVDFFKNWLAYRAGFGELTGEFWLGNSNIYLLTKQQDQELMIELTRPGGEVKYANYAQFWIDDEAHKYKLTVTGYSGGTPPGDAMAYNRGGSFSTYDSDNDERSPGSCSRSRHGAWWFKECTLANLNGQYGNPRGAGTAGLYWHTWRNYESMKATRMMVRKRP